MAMRTDAFVRGIRRITAGLSMKVGCKLSRWRVATSIESRKARHDRPNHLFPECLLRGRAADVAYMLFEASRGAPLLRTMLPASPSPCGTFGIGRLPTIPP